jgi:predicted DNA-binding transcriptional regulator YafY
MKNNLNAPIEWDSYERGYKFGKQGPGPKFELHGMWFSQEETTALVTMNHLLASLDQGGLIGPHIAPLMTRIDAILGNGETTSKELRKRIKVIGLHSRKTDSGFFSDVGYALLQRRQIDIRYYARSRDETSERRVSPQRLVHYQANWYLDGYCHLKKGLRTFALDGISQLQILDDRAVEIAVRELDEHLAAGYGIFSGKTIQKARLRFSAERARWVSAESWHGQQKGAFEPDGRYLLEVPYSDDRELLLDIRRHGGHVEVLSPPQLRRKVAQAHLDGASLNH